MDANVSENAPHLSAPGAVPPHHWVSTDVELDRWCQLWRSVPALFLDTEFVRTDTFFPKPGLLQVCDGDRVVLVDAPAIQDWSAFAGLMGDAGVLKVLHACSEDLVIFHQLTGALPRPLVDTQTAAALAGLGGGISYQNLVAQLVGVDLPKGHTRSDWLKRPLCEEQLDYATLDVHYLALAWKALAGRLESLQRMPWVLEEGERMIDGFGQDDPAEAWRKVKLAWQLNPRQLAVLRALLQWREATAREQNLPRGWLLKDDQALLLARKRPRSMQELQGLRDLQPPGIRRHGQTWLELVASAATLPDDALPQPLEPPLSPRMAEQLKRLRHALEQRLDGTGIPSDLVLRRKDLEVIVRERRSQSPAWLEGWRTLFVAPSISEWLEEERNAPAV